MLQIGAALMLEEYTLTAEVELSAVAAAVWYDSVVISRCLAGVYIRLTEVDPFNIVHTVKAVTNKRGARASKAGTDGFLLARIVSDEYVVPVLAA